MVKFTGSDGAISISDTGMVTQGVPQGSVLGPLLFILYSSDIVNCMKHAKYHLYADDLQVYISAKPSETSTAVENLNKDLNSVATWSNRNGLVLNPTKSKYMVVGTRKQTVDIMNRNPIIQLKDCSIEHVYEARNLGVLMDSELRFEKHISIVVRNCFYRLKMLYKIRNFLTEDMRLKLCESLIVSRLNYADTVIAPCLLARTNKMIQKVQNACSRFCYDIPKRSHVTPYLTKGSCLKMESRQKLHFACLLFGVVQNQTPEYLYDKLTWRKRGESPIRATGCVLVTPRCRMVRFRGSFRYNATKCWNNLPPPLREVKTISCFRKKYKALLIEQQKEFTSVVYRK